MKVLITGTNGYIGKSLAKALQSDYEITAITRKEVDLLNAHEVLEYFKDKYFDVVIHCAVVGGSRLKEDSWQVLDANLIMYYNLLNCRDGYSRLIHFGSGAEVYMPDAPYGFSKRVIAKSIANDSDFYNIRIFGLFDENELDTRFIKANIKRYLKKEPIQIYQDKAMDFFYMQDLIEVVKYFIEDPKPIPNYDCTYGKYYKLSEIAEMINNLDEHKVDILITNEGETEPYTATQWCLVGLNLIGLEKGIKNVYEKIKNETN